MDLSNWLKRKEKGNNENMITLYDWLKRKKAANNEDRMITLMYENSIMGHKKAGIKSSKYGYRGYYMVTLTDEERPVFYTINYLLDNINEEFLREYCVTGGKTINAPCSSSDDFAYELVVSEKISPQITTDPFLIKYPIVNYADLERAYDNWKPLIWSDDKKPLEIKKLIVDGPATIIFWSDETKTVVKCDKDDIPDYEKGILYAALKKLSNKKEYNDILRLVDAFNDFNKPLSELFPDMVEVEKSTKSKNLCDSCGNKGCIFQSGIVRRYCDFYKAESKVEK